MILPSKHVSAANSLLGIGAFVIQELRQPETVSSLWERVRRIPEVGNFWRYILALDLLYLVGTVEVEDGLIKRCQQ